MARDKKQISPAFAVFFAMLLAVAVLFATAAQPAWAESDKGETTPKAAALQDQDSPEDGDGQNVHVNPKVFMKNYELTAAEKQYTITEIEKALSEIIDPNMSDLEKYYRIAVWVNDRVEYDSDFWSGGYNFDFYSHQWDAYGGMKEDELSVCVGIAIFYANMCHAADLPCRVVRLDPTYLDHTINYIPDINGHGYFADVTENVFLMTDKSGSSFVGEADKEFANIPDDAAINYDYAFDYAGDDVSQAPPLKDDNRNYATYDEWYKEYVLHEGTDKKFMAKYVENGSGLNLDDPSEDPKPYHASYSDKKYYPSQNYYDYSKGTSASVHKIDKPDLWFMDDFYTNSDEIKSMVSQKKLDEQILNVSGVKKNYNVNSEEKLLEAVAGDLTVEMFPSVDSDGNLLPEPAELIEGTDYELTCKSFDAKAHMAELEITGTNPEQGSYPISVTLNSAAFTKEPVQVKQLIYSGEELQLVQPGKAKIGSMPAKVAYAVLDNGEQEPTEKDFSAKIPAAVNAGQYFIWYKALGGDGYADSPVEKLERPVTIAKLNLDIDVENMTVEIGKTATLHPTLEQGVQATYSFESEDPSIATVTSKGVVKGIREGYAEISINAESKDPNYEVEVQSASVEVVKATNPIKLKGKTVKIKAKDLKKKAKTIKRAQAIKVKKAKGKLRFKLVSAKKDGKNYKSKFKINAKTGKVTVKKGLKKGTYKVKVKVKAKGTKKFKASKWKKVTFKVKVK